MNRTTTPRRLTLAALGVTVGSFTMAPAAHGALQLDFGDASGYVGTNTPGHEDGGISDAENTFTPVTADTTVAAFGTTVIVDMARNNGNDDSNAEAVRAPVTVTAAAESGIFSTELTDDALQSFTTGPNLRSPIGVEIEDLPDGNYIAYIVAHYSGNDGLAQRVFAGTLSSGQSLYDISDLPLQDTLTATTTDSWVEGNNYSEVAFTISGNSFYILVDDTAANSIYQTTLTSLQIEQVPIPEPASPRAAGLGRADAAAAAEAGVKQQSLGTLR